MEKENKELKKKNSELEQSLRELEIIKSENATLKEYVNLKDKYTDYKTIPAYIIQKDISNYSDTIIINVGSKDGIKENMPVISDQGLVRSYNICNRHNCKSSNNNRHSKHNKLRNCNFTRYDDS